MINNLKAYAVDSKTEAKTRLIEAFNTMEVGDSHLVRGLLKANVIATVTAWQIPLNKRFIVRTVKGGFSVMRSA